MSSTTTRTRPPRRVAVIGAALVIYLGTAALLVAVLSSMFGVSRRGGGEAPGRLARCGGGVGRLLRRRRGGPALCEARDPDRVHRRGDADGEPQRAHEEGGRRVRGRQGGGVQGRRQLRTAHDRRGAPDPPGTARRRPRAVHRRGG